MFDTIDIERDPSSTKGRGYQADRNLQTTKNNVPQTIVALATPVVKNPGKLV